MKKDITNNMSRALYKVGFQLKKHSPIILLVTGLAAGVGCVIAASVSSTKLNDVMDDSKKRVDDVHKKYENTANEKEEKKELTTAYVKTGLEVAKLYAPAAALGAVSVTCILASYGILHKRNVALTAAYAVVENSFNAYRKNVKERFGDRVDFELKHNIKSETVETIDIDENGNTVTEKKTMDVINDADLPQYSEYSKIFDEGNVNWQDDAEYNKFFLKIQEQHANDMLRAKGHLYLNEVYDLLGFEHTKAGQVVGWVYDEKNPTGDNFVDFGIFDVNKRRAHDFINGYEKCIILDFNVDGNIWELMK